MTESAYIPPEVWTWEAEGASDTTHLNRPVGGATHEKALPVGEHSLQLYSLATPNGVKATILLEELLELGKDAEYDAWLIDIAQGDQFGSGFVDINPNSKIPALLDRGNDPATRVFESGSILIYLADKFKALMPSETTARTECLNWLFWQIGSVPFVGGGFGHFYASAPEKIKYPIDRYTMETKRQLDILNRILAEREFLIGDEYTIADIANVTWYGGLVLHNLYDAGVFLDVESYGNVARWAKSIEARPAVSRGVRVNRPWGPKELQVIERHSAADFGDA